MANEILRHIYELEALYGYDDYGYDDDGLIVDYSDDNGSTSFAEVILNDLSGRELTIPISSDDNIMDLKNAIASEWDVSANAMDIVTHDAKMLADSDRVYGHTHLTVVFIPERIDILSCRLLEHDELPDLLWPALEEQFVYIVGSGGPEVGYSCMDNGHPAFWMERRWGRQWTATIQRDRMLLISPSRNESYLQVQLVYHENDLEEIPFINPMVRKCFFAWHLGTGNGTDASSSEHENDEESEEVVGSSNHDDDEESEEVVGSSNHDDDEESEEVVGSSKHDNDEEPLDDVEEPLDDVEAKPYTVFIRVPDNEEVKVIEINANDKIDHLKGQIQCKTGIRPDLQRLKFNNKVLVDGAMTAAEADITKDCMLQLLPPPLIGGGGTKRQRVSFTEFQPKSSDPPVIKSVLNMKELNLENWLKSITSSDLQAYHNTIDRVKHIERVAAHTVEFVHEIKTLKVFDAEQLGTQ
jgi:hypothetical protein